MGRWLRGLSTGVWYYTPNPLIAGAMLSKLLREKIINAHFFSEKGFVHLLFFSQTVNFSFKEVGPKLSLFCVTVLHLVLHSCDLDSADSRLKLAGGWYCIAGPGSAGIRTIKSGSIQMPDLQLGSASQCTTRSLSQLHPPPLQPSPSSKRWRGRAESWWHSHCALLSKVGKPSDDRSHDHPVPSLRARGRQLQHRPVLGGY